jgi:hypothetical protein
MDIAERNARIGGLSSEISNFCSIGAGHLIHGRAPGWRPRLEGRIHPIWQFLVRRQQYRAPRFAPPLRRKRDLQFVLPDAAVRTPWDCGRSAG